MGESSSKRYFDDARSYGLCLLVALVVALPTLGMGFALDDYIPVLMREGRWPLGSSFDLF